MKCRFCNENLEEKSFRDSKYWVCKNHAPSRVGYKPITPWSWGDQWHITQGNYRLTYYNGETLFRKMNFESNSSPKDFYTLIKKFDHELKIKPEDFGKKLPTLLTFL